MESQRNLLLVGLLFVSYLLWQQWQLDQNPQPEAVQTTATQVSNDVPHSAVSQDTLPEQAATGGKLVTVTTDTLKLVIDTQGGDIIESSLLQFPLEQDQPEPLKLLQRHNGFNYVARSGLIGAQGPDSAAERPTYQVASNSYDMGSQDQLVVPMSFVDANGIQFEKRFVFTKGKYDVRVEYVVNNQSANNASMQMFGELRQSITADKSNMMMPTYRGGAYSTADTRYKKYDFDDMKDAALNKPTQGGWVAMLQHYFVTAWVPGAEQQNALYTKVYNNGSEGAIGVKQPVTTVAAGSSATFSSELYIGPKNQEALSALSDSLNLVVDYGWLWFIAQPLHWLLTMLQSLVVNWGVAIIGMTLLVRGALYPLTKAQYTSMAKMRNLQPKMEELKKKFGDDRQRLSQGMMELYQKEKVNPMGGCLPMLLQFPIFIAFYWVLLESVELRHAPFALWITDLSVKDPYYILPLLMGLSMFVMQRMQPVAPGMDPMQQKMMQYMPVIFTVFFLWFPSGLVLYWLFGNLVAITQQWFIYRSLAKQGLK
ncbi:membrane protein insertase YidC [Ferrimonas sp. SCSIO 43195]|uniref:membrane protein insertase YidC n=1 Tax=Ferrimonas sp. SCSIO 43195 TaxID=2822844 RepID=UPI00207572B6|nr:membrane protein insertase YidC [Ferrimonas sp. SCSIO 43195]USD37618.1 membrane protein insertase YidC [Ferrimonas sp. SCSIO 43195]